MNKLVTVSELNRPHLLDVSVHQSAVKPALLQHQMEKSFHIYTLGHIQIFHHGVLVNDFGNSKKKPMDMLKLLIAFGAREVSQEKISELLWPDAEGDAAQQVFDTTLHRLRKIVGTSKLLLLREGRLSLNTDLCWLDCWNYERVQKELEKNLNNTIIEASTINKLSQQLFDLYSAHFLHNDNESPWLFGYRQRLQSKFIRIIKKMGHYWEQQQKPELALDMYLRALETDWYLEEFYQRAMKCYKAMDLRAEGLMLYQRCRMNLMQNMHIEPSAETEAIRSNLLNS